jgi:hypothetical protein
MSSSYLGARTPFPGSSLVEGVGLLIMVGGGGLTGGTYGAVGGFIYCGGGFGYWVAGGLTYCVEAAVKAEG